MGPVVILMKPSLRSAKHYYSLNLLIINTDGERRNEREDVTPRIDMMRGITPQNQHYLLNQSLRLWLLVTFLTLPEEIQDQKG
jgi:hypothetical protein